jgi:thiamine biosynthesis lipoprotein
MIHRFAGRCMGSRLVLQVAGTSRPDAETAWMRASMEMAATDAALSRFRPDSDLSLLNGTAASGQARAIDARLRQMLALSHRAQRLTDGRFDPRTLEVLEALGERAQVAYASAGGPLTPNDGSWLQRRGRHGVSISAPVDSGGIGKGLGLRWALAAAGRAVPRAGGLLLEAGGDVAAAGEADDGEAWHIGIEDPGASSEPMAVVGLREGALATSSTAVRAWTTAGGLPAHHLIDPRTWRPADGGLRAVSVAHRDPAWAEVWSKALFVGGAAGIGPEARARGLAAWWVEDDGSLHLTPAASEITIWRRDA